MPTPNAFAYLMLMIWPLVSWRLWKQLDPARALIWSVLGGYLILPPLTAINFPIIPDLDKTSIPNLVALYCAVYLLKDKISLSTQGWVGKILISLFVLSPFATVLTNDDPLYFQQSTVQGMRIYDSIAAVANQAIALIPFFLARHYLGNPQGVREVLWAFIAAGLVYSVPMLIEARFSPQMNIWVYGFFQHDFFQTIRQGGYRPVVFLQHGLWVAFFTLMCVLAALLRLREAAAEDRPKALMVVLYLLFMLVVCKSAGPMIYALMLAPLLLLAPPRLQVAVAAGLALIVVSYPLLRGAHVVPLEWIQQTAASFSADRAYSLQFRINNEELLLARAQERPWFGWGGYGRSFLHDGVTGEITTIADGAWVISLGIYGWLGYAAEFGLTALPLLALGREALTRYQAPFNRYSAALALILAANMVDLLPNATHVPLTWLMAGALLGEAERMAGERKLRMRDALRSDLHGGRSKRTVI